MQSLAWYDSQTQVDSSQTGDYILIVTWHNWTSALLAPTSDYRRVIELCACVLFVRTAVSRTEQSGVVHLRMRTLSIKSTIPTSEQQEKKTHSISVWVLAECKFRNFVCGWFMELWGLQKQGGGRVSAVSGFNAKGRRKKALFISVTWFFSTGLQCHIASLLKIQHMESKAGLVWEAP